MFQGDIVLVKFPFSNMVDYKIRPALIVSNNFFNQTHDVWVCPITSSNKQEYVALSNSIEEGKLDKDSFAKITVIGAINSEGIIKVVGKLTKQKTKEIIEELKLNF